MTADGTPPRFSDAALAEYQDILGRYPTRRAALMPTLWLAQREFGWLSTPVQEYVATLMELPLAWVSSVASFYTMYWKQEPGRLHLQLCRGLPCMLRGAGALRDHIERTYGICNGQRTADGSVSFEEVECLASCGTAPVVQVSNGDYHENLDEAGLKKLLAELTTGRS